jgi:hypothetical protein
LNAENIIHEMDKKFGKQRDGMIKRHKKGLKEKDRELSKMKNEL